jgi:hypothetical protein
MNFVLFGLGVLFIAIAVVAIRRSRASQSRPIAMKVTTTGAWLHGGGAPRVRPRRIGAFIERRDLICSLGYRRALALRKSKPC